MLYWESGQTIYRKIWWFTLVEIMVVIVILILLTQIWNVGSLFRTRESNKLEEISVIILSTINREKLSALLWKTDKGIIVRSRWVQVEYDNEKNMIHLSTQLSNVEKDENTEWTYEQIKTWTSPFLKTYLYVCPQIEWPLEWSNKLKIIWDGDNMKYSYEWIEKLPPHIVIHLTNEKSSHEIHLDNRTGLTYEQRGKTINEDGTWTINC